jgi:two-component system, cell cycle sensor histidine kinase and response regulator CckA
MAEDNPIRILFVEDLPSDMELAEHELRHESIQFTSLRVETRERFLKALEEFRPDLIISDYALPEFDGMQALKLCRERHPFLPFIILTGSMNEETAVSCLKAGATDYVIKERIKRLSFAVKEALEQHKIYLEKKLAEQALLASEERFRSVIEQSLDGIALIDDLGIVIEWNLGMEQITGLRRSDICGCLVWDAQFQIITDEKKKIPGAYARSRDSVQELIRRGFSSSFIEPLVEREIQRPDGTRRFLQSTVFPIKSTKGMLYGMITRDITGRKQTEEDLKNALNDWESIFQAVGQPTLILDPHFTILQANSAAINASGYIEQELKGKLCYEVFHRKDHPPEPCPLLKMTASGHIETTETEVETLGGIFIISCTPVFDGTGALQKVIHVATEITDRKRAEAEQKKLREQLYQAQKMETIGHLAGGIAHDFNNILSAIIGYASLLQTEMKNDDPLYSYVEHILSASERAAILVHSLLAFSRKQTLSIKPVKINDLVSSVSKLLVRLLGEDITLETVFSFSDPVVMADASQIDQILFNLSTNARDAMAQSGHLTINTDIAAIDEMYIKEHGYGVAGDYALITVTDTGAGMDKPTQDKIFEPFFTTKEVGKGTGLGLSTAYGIVKQHNGFINCYSEPGKGTIFKIYLPLLKTDEKIAIEPVRKGTLPQRGGEETILVAEDDATVRQIIVYILTQYGYTVLEAEDGAQAVQVFTEHAQEVDLLLFDVIMPNKNGKDAYMQIQNIKPGVPVIFSSGYTADIILQQGILEEGFEMLLKPVSMTALLQKVREVLDR